MNVSGEGFMSLCAALADANERAVVALGTYGLVHAGTVAFLRRARCQEEGAENSLFAIVLVPADSAEKGGADRLMLPEERVRVLEALVEVDGVGMARTAGDLRDILDMAPAATYAVSADEGDVDAKVIEMLHDASVRVARIETGCPCTTAALLERMAR